MLLRVLRDISAREKTAAIKEIDKLDAILKDGVKVNYQKFKDVLVPIKD